MQHKYYSCDGYLLYYLSVCILEGCLSHKVSHQKINNINNYWTYFRTVFMAYHKEN